MTRVSRMLFLCFVVVVVVGVGDGNVFMFAQSDNYIGHIVILGIIFVVQNDFRWSGRVRFVRIGRRQKDVEVFGGNVFEFNVGLMQNAFDLTH